MSYLYWIYLLATVVGAGVICRRSVFGAGVTRMRIVGVIASLVWFHPLVYELWVQSGCEGECNIRVDLAVVVPLQILALAAAFLVVQRTARASARTP